MPFRIRISLIVLGSLLAALLVLPLVWPLAPLPEARERSALAASGDVFLEADGVELRLRERGPEGAPGAALLAVHGFHETLAEWHVWARELPPDTALLRYDRVGYGLSERPPRSGAVNPYGPEARLARAEMLLQRLDGSRAVVVGHGSGAALAARLALARPERVAGLVLLAPDVEPRRGAPALLTRTPQLQRVGPALMRRLGGETGLAFVRSRYADTERISPEVLEAHLDATSVAAWDEGLWHLSTAPRPGGLRERLPGVVQPVLVLEGGADEILPTGAAEAVAEALPNARHQRLEGCGHALHDECAGEVLARLQAWGGRELGW